MRPPRSPCRSRGPRPAAPRYDESFHSTCRPCGRHRRAASRTVVTTVGDPSKERPLAASVSIKEVATAAGVSVGTVSNVLNKPHLVAEGTRDRVHAAIAELGFVRNESARQLRSGPSRAVGLVVIDAANPFFSDVARGVEDTVQAAGGVVLLGNSAGDGERENGATSSCSSEQRVRGVLIAPTGDSVPPLDSLRPARDPGRVPGPLPRGRRLLERQRRRRGRGRLAVRTCSSGATGRSRSSAAPPRCSRCATGARARGDRRQACRRRDAARRLDPGADHPGRPPAGRGAGRPARTPSARRPSSPPTTWSRSGSSPVSPPTGLRVPEDVAIVGLRRHRVRRRGGGAAVVGATAPRRARPAGGRAAVRGDPPAGGRAPPEAPPGALRLRARRPPLLRHRAPRPADARAVLTRGPAVSRRRRAAVRRRPTRRRNRWARSAGSAGCAGAGRAARPGPAATAPDGARLDQDVAEGRGLDRPASTGRPQASAVSWHSRALRAPPPTRCTTSTCRPASSLRPPHGAPVGQRQAVQDAPDRLGRGPRHRLPGRRQASAIRAGMSPGGRRSGSSGSISRAARAGTAAASRSSRSSVDGDAVVLPGAQRLLQQPQAHDVAQVADGAVDADLVGEVGRAGWPR